MRDGQAWLVEPFVAVQEHVEVDRARPEARPGAPDATETGFDLEQTLEQHARRKLGLD
jgi:hypothetical protein